MTFVPVAITALGALVLVASAVALLRVRGVYQRLHVVTPATSLGGVLVCAGLALHDRATHDVAKLVLIALLLLLTGPASTIAAARAAHRRSEGGG